MDGFARMTILHCIRLLPFFAAFALAPDAARAGGAPPGKILVEAGEISGTTKKMRAKGGVRACFEQYILNTEELEYDRQNDFLRASGSFQLSNPGLGHDMEGGSVFYRPHMRRGEANNVRMSVGEEGLRAESETLVFENGAFLARNAEISSCKPESRDWTLDAKEVREEEGQLLARHVLLRARGVPVMYFPAFPVNISDEKRGGFLPPKAEYSGGGRIGLPYYFFPAENYDATITPEWLGEQGFLIGGEFRYLMPSYRGDAEISWNPEAGRGRQRIAHRWESESKYWRIDLAADNVSDSRYFIDFSDDSALLAARNLPRRIAVQYARDGWSGSALFETLKTLNYPDAPHNRLPQLRLRRDGGGGGFFWHSEWEYTRFAAQTAEQREGGRLLWRGVYPRRRRARRKIFRRRRFPNAVYAAARRIRIPPAVRRRLPTAGDVCLRARHKPERRAGL